MLFTTGSYSDQSLDPQKTVSQGWAMEATPPRSFTKAKKSPAVGQSPVLWGKLEQ
jgi:hypothetical protein